MGCGFAPWRDAADPWHGTAVTRTVLIPSKPASPGHDRAPPDCVEALGFRVSRRPPTPGAAHWPSGAAPAAPAATPSNPRGRARRTSRGAGSPHGHAVTIGSAQGDTGEAAAAPASGHGADAHSL